MDSARPIRAKFQDSGSKKIGKYQENRKTLLNYSLLPNLTPKMEIL